MSSKDTTPVCAEGVRLVAAMRAILDAPGYPLLTSYRTDFDKHDAPRLERFGVPGLQYLWVVRESGTHLTLLGTHEKIDEEAMAAMNTGGPFRAYLLDGTAGTVREVTPNVARDLMRRKLWSVQNNVEIFTTRGFKAVADIRVMDRFTSRPYAEVDLESNKTPLDVAQLIQLCAIAECMVIKATQTFFIPARTIRLDGEDLRDLINRTIHAISLRKAA